MGIAARPGAQRLASRPCAQLGAHTSAHFSRRFGRLYSIKWKLLFNKLKHFSDRFLAVVSRRHSHPAIPIAPLHRPSRRRPYRASKIADANPERPVETHEGPGRPSDAAPGRSSK